MDDVIKANRPRHLVDWPVVLIDVECSLCPRIGRSGSARAEIFTAEIVAFCLGLSLFSKRGMRRDDLRPGLRVLEWRRRVTIALNLELDTVVTFGIFYGGQDWESTLGE